MTPLQVSIKQTSLESSGFLAIQCQQLRENKMPKIKQTPTKSKDLVAKIEKEVSPIVSEAQALTITSPESLTAAVSTLSKLNSMNDRIVEDREKITKPLNAALKEVRAKYKPLESMLETAIGLIRTKMSTYQTDLMRKKKVEDEAAAAALAAGEVSIEDAANALATTPPPAAGVRTEEGIVNFKTVQQLKITRLEEIPRKYLIVDEKPLLAALKAGTLVPGAEIEEVQVPINYRI